MECPWLARMRRPSSLNANRFLSLVATMCSSCSRERESVAVHRVKQRLHVHPPGGIQSQPDSFRLMPQNKAEELACADCFFVGHKLRTFGQKFDESWNAAATKIGELRAQEVLIYLFTGRFSMVGAVRFE